MNIDKLTVRDLCTIKVLCKDELAKLYEDDALNSEWAERVQELSDVASELLKESPKAHETERVLIPKAEDIDFAVKQIGEALAKTQRYNKRFVILTPYWEETRLELSKLGYVFSVDHNGIEHEVTFYEGGAKL